MKPKQRADKRAGEGHLVSTPGRHTRNPGYRPGRHWVLCQRCGLDYYDNEIKKEWTGALVCKSCWEPRHPQDFVRGRRDRISAPMPVNPDSLINQTAAEGSTNPLQSTFNISEIAIGTIPNQSYDSGTTISTITGGGATIFPSYTDIFGETQAPVSYGASALPTGIAINTSTGAITGTLGIDTYLETGLVTTVFATYTGEQIFSTSFSWTIANGGLTPDSVSNVMGLWWDFSEDEWSFSDVGAETMITDGETQMSVINRDADSDGTPIGIPQSGSANNAGQWDDNVKNGLGAFNADTSLQVNASGHLGADAAEVTAPYTVVLVAQWPTTTTTLRCLFGPTAADGGTNFIHTTTAEGGVDELNTVKWIGSTNNTTSGTTEAEAGEWYIVRFTSNDAASYATYNDEAATPPFESHDADEFNLSSFRVGSGAQFAGTAIAHAGWNAYIGEAIVYQGLVDDEEYTALYAYLANKWAITTSIE